MDRKRLPVNREAVTRHEAVGSHEFYVTVGFYVDEPLRPGEIFITIAKEGSTLAGMCDTLAIILSMALQSGLNWDDIAAKMRHTRFEPAGCGLDGTEYSSLVEAIAASVDSCVEYRRSLLGVDEPTVVESTMVAKDPVDPYSKSAVEPIACLLHNLIVHGQEPAEDQRELLENPGFLDEGGEVTTSGYDFAMEFCFPPLPEGGEPVLRHAEDGEGLVWDRDELCWNVEDASQTLSSVVSQLCKDLYVVSVLGPRYVVYNLTKKGQLWIEQHPQPTT